MEEKNIMKTGTTTVGVLCKDGIVLGADKRATAGYMIADKKAQKIYPITDKLAMTWAGTVSDTQLVSKLLKAELKLKQMRTGKESSVKEAANLLAGLVYGNIRKFSTIPGISHFVLGGVDDEGFHLYDVYPDGAVTSYDDYVSSGSGSVFAYGVLESSYKKDLVIKDGIALVVKALNAALQRDAATGNGIDVITITQKGVAQALAREIDMTVRV